MVSGTVKSVVENSKDVFEGVKFAVDVWNNVDQVIIQVGNQEAVLSKEMFFKMSSMVKEAESGNNILPINISNGKFI